MAADAAVEFLIENLKQTLLQYQDLLKDNKQKRVVIKIRDHLDYILPQLERAEVLLTDRSDQVNHLKEVAAKAERLTEAYLRRFFLSKTNIYDKLKFNCVEEPRYALKLQAIEDEIARAKDWLSNAPELSRVTEGDATSTAADGQSTLPAYLRKCVDYFNLFPPHVDVPARRLIVLWVAQGLVDPNENDNESSFEQTAERYLRELIDRGVVEVKRNRCEKVKSCRVAGGRGEALLAQHDDVKIRHLVDSNGSDGHSFIQIHGNPAVFNSVKKYKDAISFLSFNAEEGSKPGQDIGDFLHKCILSGSFIWLRFLDLERVFRPKLSETLGRLISLKYLGLRWTYLERLPDSVHRLFALQLLDVKHTYITVLPRSIWRMQYLRHLYLSEAYRTRFPDPPSKITLFSLQTLWGAFVDEETRVVGGLDKVRGIRKLGLSCMTRETKREDMSKQLKAIDGWISQIKSLETLRLKSRDEEGAPADLHLTPLEKNTKLSTLYLLGKLDAAVVRNLPLSLSLTDVTLSGSELDFDPMPFLGALPLVTLRLLAQSVVFNKMHCSASGFRELKFLWIWKLNSLEEFEAEEGSLPCLKELEIRSCDKLESLPDHLQNVGNLSIILTSMPAEFVDKTKANYAQVVFVPDDQYTLTNQHTVIRHGLLSL